MRLSRPPLAGIGTFQADPSAVPEPLVAAISRRLGIDDPGLLATYREMPVRWRHTAEIRDRYGYRDFTAQPDRFAFMTCPARVCSRG